ncbi:MAG TPA: response regulator transcription factor [Candidatus Ozemobacteraceae bacterium]|nr:response regulator transcription factor [Candidatus Ozemobacteraceae bacterium]
MKVLIVEDDRLMRQALRDILYSDGYQVLEAADGEAGLEAFSRHRPDFVCLDVMMPKCDGYEVCRRLRRQDAQVPIVFISAKGEEIDKVLGLELGADDFIVKPFGVREVTARIRAVTRRCLARNQGGGPLNVDVNEWPESFVLGDVTIFPRELRARRGDQTFEVSLREVRLLKVFHDRPGEVLDRTTLFRAGWGEDHIASSRTLDQHIAQLRKRLEIDPRNPRIITTVHGAGYRYDLVPTDPDKRR